MEYDELELDTLGEQKTALFVIISDTDSTFNFVVAMMYAQLYRTSYRHISPSSRMITGSATDTRIRAPMAASPAGSTLRQVWSLA